MNRCVVGGTPYIADKSDGFNIHMVDDGIDYWDLIAKFKRGEIPYDLVPDTEPARKVYILTIGERKLVLKFDSTCTYHIDRKIWILLHGSFYMRVMYKSNEAIARGCDIIQRVYLVAEKLKWGLPREAIIISEFLPGRSLRKEPDILPFRAQIAEAVMKLHSYKIALVDVHPGNFLVTDNGLKIIDVSFRSTFTGGRAKDVVRAKIECQTDIPVEGLLNRMMVAIMRSHHHVWKATRRLKRRIFDWVGIPDRS